MAVSDTVAENEEYSSVSSVVSLVTEDDALSELAEGWATAGCHTP
jgi:hypothetical protein